MRGWPASHRSLGPGKGVCRASPPGERGTAQTPDPVFQGILFLEDHGLLTITDRWTWIPVCRGPNKPSRSRKRYRRHRLSVNRIPSPPGKCLRHDHQAGEARVVSRGRAGARWPPPRPTRKNRALPLARTSLFLLQSPRSSSIKGSSRHYGIAARFHSARPGRPAGLNLCTLTPLDASASRHIPFGHAAQARRPAARLPLHGPGPGPRQRRLPPGSSRRARPRGGQRRPGPLGLEGPPRRARRPLASRRPGPRKSHALRPARP
jgi:hypothetical protein